MFYGCLQGVWFKWPSWSHARFKRNVGRGTTDFASLLGLCALGLKAFSTAAHDTHDSNYGDEGATAHTGHSKKGGNDGLSDYTGVLDFSHRAGST